MSIWLIGAGPMGGLHAKVLAALDTSPVTIVATSPTRAEPLADEHGMTAFTRGLDTALAELPTPDHAIVALPVDRLAKATLRLIEGGVRRILVEKPGALTAAEMAEVAQAAETTGAYVAIAYNRRFFGSVAAARERIDAAGGALSLVFEFCENAPRIAELPTPAPIKENWVLANSTHVIDLAFHLCGWPEKMTCEITGALPWHSRGADFRGTGVTTADTRFSYFADWRGPGRWGLEIVLPQERLVLRPMEELSVMPRGRFQAEPVTLSSRADTDFKPGLYHQMEAFLGTMPDLRLPTAAEQLYAITKVYSSIANYEKGN